ncbi:MAG: hypothetical protein GY942_10610, partial [Aestuariibacter sp.]|nr:hypothetical protein [Aestuariibacter sp.]
QALYLVAAKVAAAQRVNGDTITDDSGQGAGLAELDGITGSDIVATLARIVTGDVEVNTQSLQQAFAAANASLRQANTLIGEYEIVDDEPETLTRDENQVIIDTTLTPQQTLTVAAEPLDAFERVQKAQIMDEPSPVAQQELLLFGNGRSTNGKPSPTSITTNGHHNSHRENHPYPNGNGDKLKHEADEKRPSVPRPRLFVV